METIDNFAIRAYTKKELALMYFPDSAPRTAVNHLRDIIRRYTWLWDELQAMGYNPNRKTFTPREVKAIVDELGPPGC